MTTTSAGSGGPKSGELPHEGDDGKGEDDEAGAHDARRETRREKADGRRGHREAEADEVEARPRLVELADGDHRGDGPAGGHAPDLEDRPGPGGEAGNVGEERGARRSGSASAADADREDERPGLGEGDRVEEAEGEDRHEGDGDGRPQDPGARGPLLLAEGGLHERIAEPQAPDVFEVPLAHRNHRGLAPRRARNAPTRRRMPASEHRSAAHAGGFCTGVHPAASRRTPESSGRTSGPASRGGSRRPPRWAGPGVRRHPDGDRLEGAAASLRGKRQHRRCPALLQGLLEQIGHRLLPDELEDVLSGTDRGGTGSEKADRLGVGVEERKRGIDHEEADRDLVEDDPGDGGGAPGVRVPLGGVVREVAEGGEDDRRLLGDGARIGGSLAPLDAADGLADEAQLGGVAGARADEERGHEQACEDGEAERLRAGREPPSGRGPSRGTRGEGPRRRAGARRRRRAARRRSRRSAS